MESEKQSEKQGRVGEFTLLLFASASTYTGGLETLKLPAPTTIRELFRTLEKSYPGILKKVLSSSAVTVNLDYVDLDLDNVDADIDLDHDVLKEDQDGTVAGNNKGQGQAQGLNLVINQGDEVGIIPPVSSG
ncbi:uncharacterized protein PV06_04974 [Exophiala oligosperma]|uniref:Molybdopterin synthase sulfur carrier subunit n=2 Tax=Chaetothyriales TaxID=34395 RepID=A0A0D2AVV1_9EURO|nr:uncharacterized protein PV06_04974 [Exophiala oligosperma]KAJ9630132.1 hypothetical protein H2204_008637 [Knufia peltigerae]KIW43926.1 hypothetical protein PV06_04974 [Exophiala oligosperma]